MSRRLALSDFHQLARGSRGTTALRVGLAALLVALLAGALVVALDGSDGDPPLAEPEKTTVLVVDVSSSIKPAVYQQIGATLDRAIGEGGRFGVVLFSDIAYEMLPPGTRAVELEGLKRYFVPLDTEAAGVPTVAVAGLRFLQAPWHATFTGGTKISVGLRLAREVLEREGVRNGKVVLVSDLEDEYSDLPAVGDELAAYAAAGLPLRVTALSPGQADRQIWKRLVAGHGSVDLAALPDPDERRTALPPVPFPALLAGLGILLAVALAVNEYLLARLSPPQEVGGS
jgi:hypothetical protein